MKRPGAMRRTVIGLAVVSLLHDLAGDMVTPVVVPLLEATMAASLPRWD